MNNLLLQPTAQISVIFLHFFDVHFFEMKNIASNKSATKECRLATRFAIIASNEVLIPAASYFESSICQKIINEFSEIFEYGFIRLVGSGSSAGEFIENKLLQYPKGSSLYQCYIKASKQKHNTPPFKTRDRSATNDIRNDWYAVPNNGDLLKRINPDNILVVPNDFEERWVRVPKILESRAFIVAHVENMVFGNAITKIGRNRLHHIINESYFRSYTKEFNAGVFKDLLYLDSPHLIPSYGQNISFSILLKETRQKGILSIIESCSSQAIIQYKTDSKWLESLNIATSTGVGITSNSMNNIVPTEPKILLESITPMIPNNISIIEGKRQQVKNRIRIGIVTALPKEFAAMKIMLDEPEEFIVDDDPNDYIVGKIATTDKSGSHTVVVTLLKKMGNNSAAVAAANLLRSFQNALDVLMVGIAGGIPDLRDPDQHIRLGDVVVSKLSGVVQFDNGKLENGIFTVRDTSPPPSALLQGQVNSLEARRIANDYPWENYLPRADKLESSRRPPSKYDKIHLLVEKDGKYESREEKHPRGGNRRPNKPKIHYGLIGSSNTLLKDAKKRDELYEQHRIRAVEMEGSGIADAAWIDGKHYLLIRGITDYGDSHKGDKWQGYAAVAAAAYARALIESISLFKYPGLASLEPDK